MEQMDQAVRERKQALLDFKAEMQCFVAAGQDKTRVKKFRGGVFKTDVGNVHLEGVRCTIIVQNGVLTITLSSQ